MTEIPNENEVTSTRMTRGAIARQQEIAIREDELMDHSTSSIVDGSCDSSFYTSSVNNSNLFRTPSNGRGRKRTVDDPQSPSMPKRGRGGRGGAIGRGRGRRSAIESADDTADESSLFSLVKSGKDISTIVDQWIEEYEHHADNALVQLQQLFISASGCKGIVTSMMLQQMDYSEIIRRMTEEFDEESGDYPMVMAGTVWRKFRAFFTKFIEILVSKCKQSILFDQKMMDSVIRMLVGLADSQVRAFRHTATHAAMKLSSSLVIVSRELVTQTERNARQIETEKSKTHKKQTEGGGGNERLEVLITAKNELAEKMEDVKQMLQYVFRSVFVHRYRDILPDIRCICVSELGGWLVDYPQSFLDDSYLKYLGWSLFDKIAEVRLRCISALLPLYSMNDGNLAPRLELFTNKFKTRLVSMVNDKDLDVAIQTTKLITNIYHCFPDLIVAQDCSPIYDLVFSNNRNLAIAAGDFLSAKVFSADDRRHRRDNGPLLRDLIEFFIESQCHEHAAYLVDSLIDANPMLKDWQCMTDLLLGNHDGNDWLDDAREALLLDIFACAGRQTTTGESPAGRLVSRKTPGMHTKELKQCAEDQARLTEQCIPVLPRLLHKYIADADKLANLLRIPLLFDLGVYLAGRLDKHLDELVTALETVVEKHVDDEVLGPCAAIFDQFTRNVGVKQHTDTVRLKLIDGLALQLKQRTQQFNDEQELDDEDQAALLASFRKMTAFAACHDLSKWALWDVFYLVAFDESRKASRDLCEKALLCCFLTIANDLALLVNDVQLDANTGIAIERLRKKRDLFIDLCKNILQNMVSGCETAFLTLCDILLLFNHKLGDKNVEVETLVHHVGRDLEKIIIEFVVDNVFGESDDQLESTFTQQQQIELMHKRRNLLAQFCKLVIYGVVSIQTASNVFQYYIKFYTDYGDILKFCLAKCRELDLIQCSRAVAHALIDGFNGLKMSATDHNVDPVSDEFNALRELAKRFALTFGNDQLKNREAIATIHREGIVFALEADREDERRPKNVHFMEVLIEFSHKLMRQDKLAVLRYLERRARLNDANWQPDDPTWQPYLLYRDSLQDTKVVSDDVSSVRSFQTGPTPTTGRGRGRGRGAKTHRAVEYE